jgi:hypothetical protein
LLYCVDNREGRTQLKLEPGVEPGDLQYAREKTQTHTYTQTHLNANKKERETKTETERVKREKENIPKIWIDSRADKKPVTEMKGPSC